MKLIGLCGTLTILLICNPEAHCFILLGILSENQAMILKLDEQITSLQNAADQQNLVIQNQLPKINDQISQLRQRLLNYQVSVKILMEQMKSTSTQLKETERTLSAIRTSIESVSATVTNVAAINVSTDKINIRLYDTDQKLNNAYEKRDLNLSKDSMRTMCLGIAAEDHLFKHQISETDKLLKKYDQRLSTYNATVDERDFVLLDSIEANCDNEFEKQQREEIEKIRLLLSEADNTLKELPSRSDSLYALHNVTLDSIGRIGHDITEIKENYLPKLTNKVLEVNNSLGATNGIIKYLNQTKTMSNKAYKDIMANFSEILQEIQAMSKKESMIFQTASKIDIAHESKFLEIKDLIKEKTQILNNKLNNSITEAQPATIDKQITTLIEIANKIKSEMECLSSDIVDIYEVTVNKMKGVRKDMH